MSRTRTNLARYTTLIALVLVLGALALAHLAATTLAQATTIEVTTTDDELNDDGDCSLREAVQAANTNAAVDACPAGAAGSDTITLPAGTYTLALPGTFEDANASGDLDIIDDLVLEGAGAAETIVDGGGIDRVLHITPGVAAEMSGVTIQNGHILTEGDEKGAGAGIFNRGNLVLSDSIVRENSNNFSGGGIYSANNVGMNPLLQPGDATLTLQNTRVLRNTADGGGGIFAVGALTMRDSAVNGNTATTAFGGISMVGAATIANTTINANQCDGEVGGLSMFGILTMEESEVSHNRARQIGGLSASSPAAFLGIPLPGEVILNRTTISHNQAGASVGGLVVHGAVTLDESTISDNRVTGDTEADPGSSVKEPVAGGMLAGGDALTLRNSEIISNTAVDYGGGLVLAVDAEATLSNMTIRENVASQGFGGGITNFGSATIEESTITMNTASAWGGGGIANLGHLEIRGTTISANTSPQWGGGGVANGDNAGLDERLPDGSELLGIDIPPNLLQITDSTIEGNSAIRGGGILNEEGATIEIIDTTLCNNRAEALEDATATGGAVANLGTLEMRGSMVEGNESTSSTGGLINAPQGTMTIRESEILSNSTDLEGGGVGNTGTMKLIDTTISANSSSSGGGIFNGSLCEEDDTCEVPQVRATLEMQNTTVSDNIADSVCGGIFNYGDLVMSDGSQVTGNQMQGSTNPDAGGGGICNLSTESFELPDRPDTPAFEEIITGTMTISDSTISDNRSGQRAGGIINHGYLKLSGSTVAENQANRNGGGIVNTYLLTVTDTTLRGNTALNENGGGIENLALLWMSRSTITENSASNGGGVHVSNANHATFLTNVTISDNTATIVGGGIVVESGAGASLVNTTVSHNQVTGAEGVGAGVFSNGTVEIVNSIVANNLDGDECATSQGTIISYGGNLASNSTCPFTNTTDLPPGDPLLGDLQDNGGPTFTRALTEGSPAIDAARNVYCPWRDQRGFARAVDGDEDGEIRCDIGAFEYGSDATLEIVALHPDDEEGGEQPGEEVEQPGEEVEQPGEDDGQEDNTSVITATITPAGGSITITSGSITFPPGAVETTIIISYTELLTDTIPSITDTHHVFRAFRLEATTSAGQPVHQFEEPFTITLTYDEDALATQQVSAEQLALFFWDGSAWRLVAQSAQCPQCGVTVDDAQHEVIIALDHLTDFALAGRPTPQQQPSLSHPVYLPLMVCHSMEWC